MPIEPSEAKLGELVGTYRTNDAKYSDAKKIYTVVLLLGIGIAIGNFFVGLHWSLYLIGGLAAVVSAFLLFTLESFEVRLYTRGIVLEQHGRGTNVYPWLNSSIGESRSEGLGGTENYDFFLRLNNDPATKSIYARKLERAEEEQLHSLLHHHAYQVLAPAWLERLRAGQSIDYHSIVIRPDGVMFKKQKVFVEWTCFNEFSLDEDGKLVFRDRSGKPVATKLWMYEVPYVFELMRLAPELAGKPRTRGSSSLDHNRVV
ncbi:MAG: hypothetical protein AAFX06_33385 [Planctomycetota bacterium]